MNELHEKHRGFRQKGLSALLAGVLALTGCSQAPNLESFFKGVVSTVESVLPNQESQNENQTGVPKINGLQYVQENENYVARSGNPYKLPAGKVAGVFVKDALEINDRMESAIGLKYKVLDVMMTENAKKGIYSIALPFNLKENHKIKIRELISKLTEEETKGTKQEAFLDELAVNIDEPVKFYAPVDFDKITAQMPTKTWTIMDCMNTKNHMGVLEFVIGNWENKIRLYAKMIPGQTYKQEDLVLHGEAKGGEVIGTVFQDDIVQPFTDSGAYKNPGEYHISFSIFVEPGKFLKAGKKRTNLETLTKIGNSYVFVLPDEGK